jgi:hypothetical protein
VVTTVLDQTDPFIVNGSAKLTPDGILDFTLTL